MAFTIADRVEATSFVPTSTVVPPEPGLYKKAEDVLGVHGATVFDDGVTFDAAVQTSVGVGEANTGVTAAEYGDGVIHQTVLTFSGLAVPVAATTTSIGTGGMKLYTFPKGVIAVLGVTGAVSLAIAEAKQPDVTDATPEGDIGLGSVTPADKDALGTDATDDDLAGTVAYTMTAYAVADLALVSEGLKHFNGTSTATTVNLNASIDAADIDDGASTELLATGTVTINWMKA